MFSSIVESVINEITAVDAYDRFYSDLPKEEFFNLANMYGKFDNFMKMVMNDLKEDDCSYYEAEQLISKYIGAPNNVRAEFSRRFSSGTIESVEEARVELDMLLAIGFASEKEMYTAGYSVLYDDEKYKITCTTTYAANHHFFGKTKWCTASDRNGRYDGWHMFLDYTYGSNYYDEEFYETFDSNNVEACLFQVFVKTGKKELYQIQLYKNGTYGQICDSEDNETNEIKDDEFVKGILMKSLGNCVELMKKNVAIEAKYYESIEIYHRKRKKILMLKNQKKVNDLRKKAITYNFNKAKFVLEKYREVANSNLLKDYNFIKEIVDEYYDFVDNKNGYYKEEYWAEQEDFLSKHGYLSPYNSSFFESEKLLCCKLFPILGVCKNVSEDNVNYVDSKIIDFFQHNQNFKVTNFYTNETIISQEGFFVILNKLAKQVVTVIKVNEHYSAGMTNVILGRYDSNLDGYIILRPTGDDYYLINVENGEKVQLPEYVFSNPSNNSMTYRRYGNYFVYGKYPGSSYSFWGLFDLNAHQSIGMFCCFQTGEDFVLINNELGCYFIDYDKCYKLNYKPSFEFRENEFSQITVNEIKAGDKKIMYITNKNGYKVDIVDLQNNSVLEYGANITHIGYNYNQYRTVVQFISNDGTEKIIG